LLALGKSDLDALIADFPMLANKILVRPRSVTSSPPVRSRP
jgi:hypothetical protein